MNRIKTIILLSFAILIDSQSFAKKAEYSIKLNAEAGLMTATIQKAINTCTQNGGGIVVFTSGTYLCGGIELKSKVKLQFEKGTILQGSDNYADYNNDAFIFGKDLTDIAIQGEGIIDGVDCINKQGEEGFRGPHCLRLINCKNISFEGFTIKNSANWAINCRYCSFGKVDKVSIRGGHDGLHTRFCNDFTVTNCDFRTGDDAFAGNDNRNITVTNCKVNTSCNGFRMGCMNFTVKHCQIWGPGESVHKIQKRNNMLSAFVHFSPKDENPKLESGNWLIENVSVENVDQFYVYSYPEGLWQTGQPVTTVRFKNIKVSGILAAFNIIGDKDLKFKLNLENSNFAFREGTDYKGESFEGVKLLSPALFNATSFNEILLKKVILSKQGTTPILNCYNGNSLTLDRVNFVSDHPSKPYVIDKIKDTNIKDTNISKPKTN
jgi:hypothetical protein